MKFSQPNKLHIIYIPFRGVGIYDNFRSDEWVRERIEIFNKYTLNSLKNQTNKDFVLWISLRPKDYLHSNYDKLFKYLNGSGLKYVVTYHGLMYWDDKYTYRIIPFIKNALRIVRGCYRIGNWRQLPGLLLNLLWNKNKSLKSRLNESLKILYYYLHEVAAEREWVYLTRLDSDDMLHRDAVHEIQSVQPDVTKAITMRNGYIYNTSTGEIASYHPNTNPPFHTIVFLSSVFFSTGAHLSHYQNFRSHEDIEKIFNCEELLGRWYCVGIHNKINHISTIWDHPFRGGTVEEGKEDVLKSFSLL